jgi:hypothetical protein
MILFNPNLTLKELVINLLLNIIVWTVIFVAVISFTGLFFRLWGAELIELQNFLGSGRVK